MLFVAGLYALATALLVALGLHLGALAVVRWLRPAAAVPEASPDAPWPDVLVQVPVYNEPTALAARVLDAVGAQRYPGRVRIQLLDDSTDGSERMNAEVCVERGVAHVRRARREGFKAGALGAGLSLDASASRRGGAEAAPFAAVLDVDFVPPPDFLRRTVGALLADGGLAFAQARWTHPGAGATALGRLQAAVLDVHFAVEQGGRDRLGVPLAFNGTAGTWRVGAIEAAGGWQGDTLAEDLDLALRAQLGGWRARLLDDLAVPATLPPTLSAWRVQQTRWTKGGVEVARKLLGRVWRSGLPLRARVTVTFQTLVALALPALLAVVVLHPLLGLGLALGEALPPALGLALHAGYLALGGVLLAHVVAQRALYPASWRRRLAAIPLVLAAPIALIGPASRGVAEALAGRRSPFVRTPKDGAAGGGASWGDLALAGYGLAGLVALVAAGAWATVPFQLLLAIGGVAVVVVARREGRRDVPHRVAETPTPERLREHRAPSRAAA